MTVEELAAQGRIEAVPADSIAAAAILEEAKRHLSSAGQVAHTDANGAYSLLYDAARKAVSAHMLAGGYRASPDRPGAHEAIVLYAESAFTKEPAPGHVRHFDRMRRTRNRSEYGVRIFGLAEVLNDLDHARAIVAAAEAGLAT